MSLFALDATLGAAAQHCSRPPLQPVAANAALIKQVHTQAKPAAAHGQLPAWGLSQEAAYFAELDSEALLEDVQDCAKPQVEHPHLILRF